MTRRKPRPTGPALLDDAEQQQPTAATSASSSTKDKGASAPPPDMLTHKLVTCEDGPRAGAWYFLKHGRNSWEEQRRLALHHGETEHDGSTLGYLPIGEQTQHRTWPGISADVLVWEPDLAQAANAKARQQHRTQPDPADPGEVARHQAHAAATAATSTERTPTS